MNFTTWKWHLSKLFADNAIRQIPGHVLSALECNVSQFFKIVLMRTYQSLNLALVKYRNWDTNLTKKCWQILLFFLEPYQKNYSWVKTKRFTFEIFHKRLIRNIQKSLKIKPKYMKIKPKSSYTRLSLSHVMNDFNQWLWRKLPSTIDYSTENTQ